MCGLICIVRQHDIVTEEELMRSLQTLKHRGPDAQSIFIENSVGLGHARLSIIDLEHGNQPMFSDDRRFSIIYNGELYNYKELRDKFSREFEFHTKSDTEVILKAFISKGPKIFNSFRGMFAFCIYDSKEQKITFCRDHMGIKPLYYFHQNGVFVAASELQAIKSVSGFNNKLNLSSIDLYLCLQYIPAPKTIYKHVYKLMKGQFMEYFIHDDKHSVHNYYQIPKKLHLTRTRNHNLKNLDEVLKKSVEKHLVSDVPFGAFLSGGIDSTLVVNYMSQLLPDKIKTFSISFDDKVYDESAYAIEVANKLGTEHHNIQVSADALKVLPELVQHYGEPFGDSSCVPTYYVCKVASNHVKMVLSGDGGDELFAGYDSYSEWNRRISYYGLDLFTKARFILRNKVCSKRVEYGNYFETWIDIINYFNLNWRKKIWKSDIFSDYLINQKILEKEFYDINSERDSIRHVQLFDIKFYLPNDILTKVDIASMMNSIEVRTPFVDHKVLEYALSLPTSLNFNQKIMSGPNGKLMLKRIVAEKFGEKFANRKKMGFATPLKNWLCKNGKVSENVKKRLLSEESALNQVFNRNAVQTIIENKQYGPIWLLLVLDEWFNQNDFNI